MSKLWRRKKRHSQEHKSEHARRKIPIYPEIKENRRAVLIIFKKTSLQDRRSKEKNNLLVKTPCENKLHSLMFAYSKTNTTNQPTSSFQVSEQKMSTPRTSKEGQVYCINRRGRSVG
jgi:hypothetical protein